MAPLRVSHTAGKAKLGNLFHGQWLKQTIPMDIKVLTSKLLSFLKLYVELKILEMKAEMFILNSAAYMYIQEERRMQSSLV